MDAARRIAELGEAFWDWRLPRQFRTSDDIPRVDRPAGWLPRFDDTAIQELRDGAARFDAELGEIDTSGAPIGTQIDRRLLGCAVDRVTWEVDVLRNWQRDAVFAVSQALGPYFDLLLQPPPFSAQRQQDLVDVLEAVEGQLAVAMDHLRDHGVAPLAQAAITMLADIEVQIRRSATALQPHLDPGLRPGIGSVAAGAGEALGTFRSWLDTEKNGMQRQTAVGRDAFVWWLRRVALVSSTPEELLASGRQEWARAVSWETVEKNRNLRLPTPPLPASVEEQVLREARDEQQVRDFYEQHNLLSQPATLQHYLNLPLPDYLAPVKWLGVTDDLTSDGRLDEGGVSYAPEPGPELAYFYAANARDPRAGIVHEGAHYQQLALSWAHPNPLRRRYYDSLANEGIAFYNEEWMLQAGLFDDAPHTREVIWNFARLRALRVEVDVQLAIGEFDLEQAIKFFVERVPMDRGTAFEESVFYAANPGLAMSYTTGKLQLQRLLADAMSGSSSKFSLRTFHDAVWSNGNVPFSLQRWELLGDTSDIDRIDADPLSDGPPPTAVPATPIA